MKKNNNSDWCDTFPRKGDVNSRKKDFDLEGLKKLAVKVKKIFEEEEEYLEQEQRKNQTAYSGRFFQ